MLWTAAAGQVGTQHVEVTADDGKGAATTQIFDLPVVATSPNQPPSITSVPRGTIRVGDPYRYQVVATDSNSDPLTHSLPTAPAGMTLAGGPIHWVPAAG